MWGFYPVGYWFGPPIMQITLPAQSISKKGGHRMRGKDLKMRSLPMRHALDTACQKEKENIRNPLMREYKMQLFSPYQKALEKFKKHAACN